MTENHTPSSTTASPVTVKIEQVDRIDPWSSLVRLEREGSVVKDRLRNLMSTLTLGHGTLELDEPDRLLTIHERDCRPGQTSINRVSRLQCLQAVAQALIDKPGIDTDSESVREIERAGYALRRQEYDDPPVALMHEPELVPDRRTWALMAHLIGAWSEPNWRPLGAEPVDLDQATAVLARTRRVHEAGTEDEEIELGPVRLMRRLNGRWDGDCEPVVFHEEDGTHLPGEIEVLHIVTRVSTEGPVLLSDWH